MQHFNSTAVSSNKVLSFVSAVLLMLLLTWQVNLKTTVLEKSSIGTNQTIIDVSEVGLELGDFDHAILATTSIFAELTGWVAANTDLGFKPSNSIFIPQARAPPEFI